MPLTVALRHHTSYSYDRAVQLSPQVIRLRPAPHTRIPIREYTLKIEPATHFIHWQQDPFGNYQARVVFTEKTDRLAIDVELVVDIVTVNPFDFFLESYAEQFPFSYDAELGEDLAPYLKLSDSSPELMEYLARPRVQSLRGGGTIDFLVGLTRLIYEDITYNVRMEPGVQPCAVTLDRRNGSCRDSAWLLVQLLRHQGLAARFVSGYLVQLKPDADSPAGPGGPERDTTDLHAWAEIYLPGAGWVGLDATSGLLAGEGHIPLTATPEPKSAAPVSGSAEAAGVTLHHSNSVTRV